MFMSSFVLVKSWSVLSLASQKIRTILFVPASTCDFLDQETMLMVMLMAADVGF